MLCKIFGIVDPYFFLSKLNYITIDCEFFLFHVLVIFFLNLQLFFLSLAHQEKCFSKLQEVLWHQEGLEEIQTNLVESCLLPLYVHI